jgi:hypothetical protein
VSIQMPSEDVFVLDVVAQTISSLMLSTSSFSNQGSVPRHGSQ